MGPCVSGELLLCHEPGRAHLAPVRLHAAVGLHMFGVIRPLVKRGATLLTPPELLPGVNSPVYRQMTVHFKRLPTDVTAVRSLTCVQEAMTLQTTELSERLAAVITAVGPLPRVYETVACHVSHTVCGVLAPLTLVPAVSADVAVTPLHVRVQVILLQIRVVAVGTSDHGVAGCGRKRAFCCMISPVRRHGRVVPSPSPTMF